MENYPSYTRYGEEKRPTVLDQKYPVPCEDLTKGKLYYPLSDQWVGVLESEDKIRKFGALQFGGFLRDTVRIEHTVVIPAVAILDSFNVPASARLDLFKTVTDEGFHAEQAQHFLSRLQSIYQVDFDSGDFFPDSMRQLSNLLEAPDGARNRGLLKIQAAIVTETKISAELGRFSRDESLADEVREICRVHASDERIHASQFRALCVWIWNSIGESQRDDFATSLSKLIVIMNTVDRKRLAKYLRAVTGMSEAECLDVVLNIVGVDAVVQNIRDSAKPTELLLSSLSLRAVQIYEAELDSAKNRFLAEQFP
jgi:P-aminobenzoate N-oxygenase AurF